MFIYSAVLSSQMDIITGVLLLQACEREGVEVEYVGGFTNGSSICTALL